MEEIKKLILEDDEVDEYNNLQDKFSKEVKKEVKLILDQKSDWRYLRYVLLTLFTVMLTLNFFGISFN